MNTDTEFERTIDRLKEANTLHPNLSNLWANYLLLKRTAYDKAIHEANNMLDTLSSTQDPDREMLIALFTLSRVMTASNP